MPDSSAIWNFQRNVACDAVFGYSNTFSITISGDTTISGQNYHKLTRPFYTHFSNSTTCSGGEAIGYRGAYREETLNKKVYFVQPSNSSEMLLYDFNLQVGDTIRGCIESPAVQKDTVISIDSVLVGSSYRKRWKINDEYNIYFIEGLGSTYGLIEPSPNGLIGIFGNVSLLCFKENGQSLYPNASSHCELITSLNAIDQIEDQINIFPNPSAGNVTLDFGKATIKEIQLSDILGNVILQRDVNAQSNFKIDELKSGIYILKITDADNRCVKRKIISNR
jgi:hypothetical protein